MFGNSYANKKVLITGNTGFKGCWLSIWLKKLGAEVYGYSIDVPTKPSIFEALQLDKQVKHTFGDVLDLKKLSKKVLEIQPDFIFHLAAQAIVSESYTSPVETLKTNIIGVANIMEAVRQSLTNHKCNLIIITSDKCYDNVEWTWGYRENDKLGGKDIYSGSKGGAELVFYSYYHSFYKNLKNINACTVRAGNVIGGGDWAKDRIVPDCMRSWKDKKKVLIRSPKATRPWQHVLEPLSGYLTLGSLMEKQKILTGESFNFGPRAEQNQTVKQLLADLSKYWNFTKPDEAFDIDKNTDFHEAGLLKLNCDKAHHELLWNPVLFYDELVKFTAEWYYQYYLGNKDMMGLTTNQIELYEVLASKRNVSWAQQ